jgi:hypothetical protein
MGAGIPEAVVKMPIRIGHKQDARHTGIVGPIIFIVSFSGC